MTCATQNCTAPATHKWKGKSYCEPHHPVMQLHAARQTAPKRHRLHCELGDNWKSCSACVEQFNGTAQQSNKNGPPRRFDAPRVHVVAKRTREEEIDRLKDSAQSWHRCAMKFKQAYGIDDDYTYERHKSLCELRDETCRIIRFLLSGSFKKPRSLSKNTP